MMLGFRLPASLKSALINFSDSPTYFEMSVEELTEKKVPSVSVAQAFAR